MEWIAVERKKPEVFKKILAYSGGDQVEMAAYDSRHFISSDGCVLEYVSHWMEIPYPPSQNTSKCELCHWRLSWKEAQGIADSRNADDVVEYWTAEDVMCDHETEHCSSCPFDKGNQ